MTRPPPSWISIFIGLSLAVGGCELLFPVHGGSPPDTGAGDASPTDAGKDVTVSDAGTDGQRDGRSVARDSGADGDARDASAMDSGKSCSWQGLLVAASNTGAPQYFRFAPDASVEALGPPDAYSGLDSLGVKGPPLVIWTADGFGTYTPAELVTTSDVKGVAAIFGDAAPASSSHYRSFYSPSDGTRSGKNAMWIAPYKDGMLVSALDPNGPVTLSGFPMSLDAGNPKYNTYSPSIAALGGGGLVFAGVVEAGLVVETTPASGQPSRQTLDAQASGAAPPQVIVLSDGTDLIVFEDSATNHLRWTVVHPDGLAAPAPIGPDGGDISSLEIPSLVPFGDGGAILVTRTAIGAPMVGAKFDRASGAWTRVPLPDATAAAVGPPAMASSSCGVLLLAFPTGVNQNMGFLAYRGEAWVGFDSGLGDLEGLSWVGLGLSR